MTAVTGVGKANDGDDNAGDAAAAPVTLNTPLLLLEPFPLLLAETDPAPLLFCLICPFQ